MKTELPIEELLYEEEGPTLDFKREQYSFSNSNEHQKSEIIKDILAFANAWRRTDAYILIGVEEVKGGRSRLLGINNDLDDAQLQQLVNSKVQTPIDFSYSTYLIEEVKVGVIKIPVQERPFFLKKKYGKLKENTVYIRRGSSTDEAKPDELYEMGKSDVTSVEEIPKLDFEFADLEKSERQGLGKRINVIFFDGFKVEDIPDYGANTNVNPFSIPVSILNTHNKNYFRELVHYQFVSNCTEKLAFALTNGSSTLVTDIKAELFVEKEDDKFLFFGSEDFPKIPYEEDNFLQRRNPNLDKVIKNSHKLSVKIQDLGDRYKIVVPFEKVQPKQTVYFEDIVYIGLKQSVVLHINVTIFADNISSPIKSVLNLDCKVAKKSVNYKELIKLPL
ncbi:MAG: ATP-binding protein [Thiotrichales bacterium]|nr:ATP-binding protein [Thiotrichales bacterium]